MNTPISDLRSRGFVTVSYPKELRNAVRDAHDAWMKFTALPLEKKKSLPYSNSADGVGYEFKDGSGPKGDTKENFDLTLAGRQWLEKNAGSIENPYAFAFVDRAATLVGLMKPIVIEFAKKVESEYGVIGLVSEVEQSDVSYFVRFIHYFGGRKPEEETASAHTDQSGFTLHLFESSPGLQCLTYDGTWTDMPVSEGETVIIPSMQLQYKSKGALKALCHRVKATAQTAEHGRYSAVCFVQLSRTPKYDKAKHGRLQEKEPGFNYGMSVKEFEQLFTQ
jgi:isopenicillin N synthase-like dioxygenase